VKQPQRQPQSESTAADLREEIISEPHGGLVPAGEGELDLHVPGWPASGCFSDWDNKRVAVALPGMMARCIELVFDCHLRVDAATQSRPDSLRCLAFDMLEFLHVCLGGIVDTPAAPIFRVAHAALSDQGFLLPRNPTTAWRTLEKIKAACWIELQREPDKMPLEAGPTCAAYPGIANIVHAELHGWPGRAPSPH
jgi:hypothetical protein